MGTKLAFQAPHIQPLTLAIAAPGANAVSTTEMGDAIVKALEARG